ncbi:MAG: hypothetical protein JSS60_04950 [Verrucomicrobia bacterium]|nr:hypothetical protein [Verrucomicrobiota bacterium]
MNVLKTYDDLEELSASQIRKFYGGKALGLLEAHRLSLCVLPVHLLGTDHYEAFTTAHPHLSHAEFKSQSCAFLKSLLYKEIEKLPSSLYAVRSSSQYEDSSAHSFAGIFESRLNISKEKLIEAIAEVWDSCFSLRASSYTKGETTLRMGVILQPMIEAKYSGVCFSRHPSPSNVFENQHIVIEFAPVSGEQIVQGEITPFRLSGHYEDLSSVSDAPWINLLLKSIMALKSAHRHEVDIEFVVDEQERFWLLQQRPISQLTASHALDLSDYQRKYKRSLHSLDIELLIDGCSQFLSAYLELPFQLERWMVMISAADGQQELWVHKLIDQACIYKIALKALSEEGYLDRIEERYLDHHQKILNYPYQAFSDPKLPTSRRFFQWTEFLTPLWAHYYVPMFMIDALYQVLQAEMRSVDPDYADADLFEMGTFGISSLADLLESELIKIKHKMGVLPNSFSELSSIHKEAIQETAEKYGFLKCHQIFQRGYTTEEIFGMLKELAPAEKKSDESHYRKLCSKYLQTDQMRALFEKFRRWMRFRNQEMEFVISAVVRSRPLHDEICTLLCISIEEFWNSSKELLAKALKTRQGTIATSHSIKNLAIFRSYGKTRLLSNVKIQFPGVDSGKELKGKTVFGQGQIAARVKIAFKPQDLDKLPPSKEPLVLVTGMTTPDFIPYLQKHFVALITDEGGILCHAAIVAREIRIPCIVGTGIATEKFKDGMLLKIDFDRGEVEEK